MLYIQQNTTGNWLMGPFVKSTDGFTVSTGLTIAQADVLVSKNESTYSAKSSTASATYNSNGDYLVPYSTGDSGTLGRLRVSINTTGELPVWHEYMVVPSNVYQGLITGADLLEVDSKAISDSTAAADSVQSNIGNLDASIAGLNNLSTGDIDGSLSNYDAPTKTELDSAFNQIKGGTFSSDTDTLESIRDRGDAAWVTATGFSTFSSTGDTVTLSSGQYNRIADHVLRRNSTNAEGSTDGDTLDFRSLYGGVAKLTNRIAASTDTLTIYKADDTAALGLQSITSTSGANTITELNTS